MHLSCVLSIVYHDLTSDKQREDFNNECMEFVKYVLVLKFSSYLNEIYFVEHYEKEMMFNHVYELFRFYRFYYKVLLIREMRF